MCSGGDLKYYLRWNNEKTAFSKERVQFYAAEVLLGLEHLHKFDILYRDLKPDNIMLDKSGHVVISDLGLAVLYRREKAITSVAGTAGYWAPEVVSRRGTVKGSDIWSLGVFIHEMATASRPVCACKSGTKEWCPFGLSESMENNATHKEGKLCLRLSETMDKKRLDKNTADLLCAIFEPDPRKRIGYKGLNEIKQHPFFDGIDWRALARRDVLPPWVPPNSVNAASIGDVGEFDRKIMKKMKLTQEDNDVYAKFDFTHADSLQQELRKALMKVDNPPPEWLNYREDRGGGCCTIL
jgi:serine/threonine protein kinase